MEYLYRQMVTYREKLKLWHFTCHSYAEHKASDETLDSYDDLFDKFWEYYQGNENARLVIVSGTIKLEMMTTETIIIATDNLIRSLAKLRLSSDLLNVRDEIVGVLNKFIYLLSFN